jgi:transcriptional regulator with XRE-family HTH domain
LTSAGPSSYCHLVAGTEPFYGQLGARVREWRVHRRLTQGELGMRLTPAVTRASIANLEVGKQRVLAHTLAQLAAILDVAIGDLLPTPPENATSWAALELEIARALHLSRARAARLTGRLRAPR